MPSHRFSSSVVVLALAANGCVLVVPFEYGGQGPGEGGAGAASSAGGQGGEGASVGGASDGGGGSDPCAGLDLQTNHDNCGVCLFQCGREDCVAGLCGEAIDVGGGALQGVRVVGDKVFFSQDADGAFGARLRVLPLHFVDTDAPGLNHDVASAVGTIVAGSTGAKHVYFSAQYSKIVNACDEATCEAIDLGSAVALQVGYVMAPAAGRLYFGDAAGGRLLSMAIGDDGVPITGSPAGTAVTVEVASHAAPVGNGGIDQVRFHPPDTLFWSSLTFDPPAPGEPNADGCIYTALLSDLLDSSQKTDFECWTRRFATAGFTTSQVGDVYAQEGWLFHNAPAYRVHKFAAGSGVETSDFATDAAAPRAVDDTWLYVQNVSTGLMQLYPLDGDAPIAGPTTAAITALDVSHPDYVVYAEGSRLYRWVKPRR